MPIGAIALILDGLMTAAVGAFLLHKLNGTAETVNKQIEEGISNVIEQAPEILAQAMMQGSDDGRTSQS